MTQGKNSEGVKGIDPWHLPLTSSAEAALRTHSASHCPSGRSLPCVLLDYKPLKFGCFSIIKTLTTETRVALYPSLYYVSDAVKFRLPFSCSPESRLSENPVRENPAPIVVGLSGREMHSTSLRTLDSNRPSYL